ncbi:MAG: hypothetical protein F6K58_24885 [Symploca sp. SIO2E9]|nr:hypothetical protein [Symploca sp. SIO2E9]
MKSQLSIGSKLATLALVLFTSKFTLTACGKSEPGSPSKPMAPKTQQKLENSPSEAELKYELEGIDTTDDDDTE